MSEKDVDMLILLRNSDDFISTDFHSFPVSNLSQIILDFKSAEQSISNFTTKSTTTKKYSITEAKNDELKLSQEQSPNKEILENNNNKDNNINGFFILAMLLKYKEADEKV